MKKCIFVLCVIFSINISLMAQDFSYFNKKIQIGNTPYNSSLVYTIDDGYVTLASFEIAGVKALMWMKSDNKGEYVDSRFIDHGNHISNTMLTGNLLTKGDDEQFYAAYSTHKEGNEDDLDIAWISFSEVGDVLYKKEFDGAAKETPTFLKVLDNGDLLIGGTQESNNGVKYIVLRVNEKGEVLWKKTFGDNVVGLPSLALQSDNFLLLGSTKTANKGQDMLLISIDGTGSTNWSKTYGSKKDETASQIGILSENSYLLAGLIEEKGEQKQYYVKVDNKGSVELENTYYTSGIGQLKTQLLPVLQGEGFIGVSNFENDEGFQQPLIMRINDKAEVLWTIASLTSNTNDDLIVKDVELGVNKNGYVVTGYNPTRPYGWVASFDYTGVHCASLGCDSTDVVTGIKNINKKSTIEVSPNSVHSNINIAYNFPTTVEVNPNFQLYSMEGEEVINVQLDSSKKSTQVDTSELPSGIYFYKATYRGINLGIGKLAIK